MHFTKPWKNIILPFKEEPSKTYFFWPSFALLIIFRNNVLTLRLITDNDKLKTQNEELRILLHQYVTSEVNKELQIPPSKVLNIDS